MSTTHSIEINIGTFAVRLFDGTTRRGLERTALHIINHASLVAGQAIDTYGALNTKPGKSAPDGEQGPKRFVGHARSSTTQAYMDAAEGPSTDAGSDASNQESEHADFVSTDKDGDSLRLELRNASVLAMVNSDHGGDGGSALRQESLRELSEWARSAADRLDARHHPPPGGRPEPDATPSRSLRSACDSARPLAREIWDAMTPEQRDLMRDFYTDTPTTRPDLFPLVLSTAAHKEALAELEDLGVISTHCHPCPLGELVFDALENGGLS